ncbi:MAG: hypothetical protein F4069_05335 [Rhodothermaceae bacterium]|nr:hypothetical protein [Rhodothermaceae bacterium]MXZ18777.1 hypothetical protein [Rhodothermaceae bacterium]MYE63267.1 hypothetical protein [Rhodothermaceae bacterium]MYG70243.1 hypothetical protein [Rhodothermaceae bacterium]MYJ19907.1 hypothetical protein [Rhodothermaceae bacterium]
MSICVSTDIGTIQRIYPGFRDTRSETVGWLYRMYVHLVGRDGKTLIPDLLQGIFAVQNPSSSLQDGDLLVDIESGALLQVTRICNAKQVYAELLEPHSQRVMESTRFTRELAERIIEAT